MVLTLKDFIYQVMEIDKYLELKYYKTNIKYYN